jgi:hypothetical protein
MFRYGEYLTKYKEKCFFCNCSVLCLVTINYVNSMEASHTVIQLCCITFIAKLTNSAMIDAK